jgi:hypothetical protein
MNDIFKKDPTISRTFTLKKSTLDRIITDARIHNIKVSHVVQKILDNFYSQK